MSLAAPAAAAAQAPTPPVAEKRPKVDTLHGEIRRDDYFWMRDREDPAVIKYLEAENAYTDAMTARLKPLEDRIFEEIKGRIKETDEQVPVKRGPFFYYTRTEQGKAYPIFARKRGSLDAAEEVYFDQNEEAKPYTYFQLGGFEVSPDHRYLAVLVDTNGYEDFVLRVKDLRTGQWMADRVEKLGFGLTWAGDSRHVLYATTDSAKRSDRIWLHRVGAPTAQDRALYQERDVLFNLGVGRLLSDDWIVIESSSFTSGEIRLLDARNPATAPVRLVVPRAAGREVTTVGHGGEWIYFLTNADGATNFKLVKAPVRDPSPRNWQAAVPYEPAVFVETAEVLKEWLVITERREGLRRLRVVALADGAQHQVTFPEAAYGVNPTGNAEFATQTFRFQYSSLITPPSVFDYDLRTRERTLRKRTEVLGGYDPSRYVVERLMAPARDGTPVPVSLVRRKDAPRDGSAPLLLYAYGSYGAITEPTFSSLRFSLVDRGITYAIAHVRGGQEMGRAWYDQGKMLQKKNTFFDFIDVAEHLVRERYTSRDRLAANGGSAGGLLMGAITNLRPDLFKAVVADVPFVDVINTMLDASIPLTAQEWEQWGNPAKPDEYAYLKTYSPYDNVAAKAYPALLVMSGINDSRVAYWEPTKWVAKLRATKTDANPLLLKMNMGAGHGGSSGRYDAWRETAFRYAFVVDQLSPVVP
jgi:oligopeptidase B